MELSTTPNGMTDGTERRTVLAGATGEYREFRPSSVLDGHFQCIWFNTLALDKGDRLAVVPDGCVDITWSDGELSVAGPDLSVNVSQVNPHGTVIGLRFRAGAAKSWLRLSMSEIVGGRVPLSDFWGKRAAEIHERIGDAPSITERMKALEAALCRLAPNHEPPPSDMGFVFNALKTESAGRGMSIILDRLHMSPRTLRRRCIDAFGYGPKTLDRILRFQRFLSRAMQQSAPRLSGLAFESGYADQAHLTREVRRLSSLSPGAILAQLRRPT